MRLLLLASIVVVMLASPAGAQTVVFHIQDPPVTTTPPDASHPGGTTNAPTGFKGCLSTMAGGPCLTSACPGGVCDLGMPAKDGTGNRPSSLQAPATGSYFVRGQAYNLAGVSAWSNNAGPIVAQAAPPPPPPPPSTTFTYWLRDGSTLLRQLSQGATIDPALVACPVIEIRPSTSIGQIAKTLDAAMPASPCSAPGVVYTESAAPYAWEDDFKCDRGTLRAAGAHTLRVSAYTSVGCGLPLLGSDSLDFTVGAASPPQKPGKPNKPRPGLSAQSASMYTLNSPTALCTESDPIATSYVWDNPATPADEAIVTTKPTLPIASQSATSPFQMTVRGRNVSGDGPPSDPSSSIQVLNPNGADLDGNGVVNSHDNSDVFVPAYRASARSCAGGACGVCP